MADRGFLNNLHSVCATNISCNSQSSPNSPQSLSTSVPLCHATVMTEARVLATNLAELLTELLSAKSPTSPVRRHVAAIEWRSSERQTSVRWSLEPAHTERRHVPWQSWRRDCTVESRRTLHIARHRARRSDHVWWWRKRAWREVWRKHPRHWPVAMIVHDVDTRWRRYHGSLGWHLRRAAHLELRDVVV